MFVLVDGRTPVSKSWSQASYEWYPASLTDKFFEEIFETVAVLSMWIAICYTDTHQKVIDLEADIEMKQNTIQYVRDKTNFRKWFITED
jgi:hypothetical protein